MKALVVDDKTYELAALQDISRDAGAEVRTASNTAQAVELIQACDFDVVVTDLFFGTKPFGPEAQSAVARRDGFAVLRAAKEKDPYCQVIVVTNYGGPQLGIEAMVELGAFDYIDRGNDLQDFRTMLKVKIRKALEYREGKLAMAGKD